MLLHKLDTTDYSCLVLPRRLTNRRHRFLCFLRAAQLPSQDCVCSPVLLVQYSRVYRAATSASVVFRGGKPVHRKVCWLPSYTCSHRGIHSALRSQHCRKSEYLKPRITNYDSSCSRFIFYRYVALGPWTPAWTPGPGAIIKLPQTRFLCSISSQKRGGGAPGVLPNP